MAQTQSAAHSIPYLQVIIETINWPIASVIDQFGRRHDIRVDIMRAKGFTPEVGEQWIMDRSLGYWTLAALFVAASKTGPVMPDAAVPLFIQDHQPDIGHGPWQWIQTNADTADGFATWIYDGGSSIVLYTADKHYEQEFPQLDTWVVNHNLKKKPAVKAYDGIGREIVGDIEHIDNDTLVVTFVLATSGKVYCN